MDSHFTVPLVISGKNNRHRHCGRFELHPKSGLFVKLECTAKKPTHGTCHILRKYEEMAPSPPESSWPEAFAAVVIKIATDAAARSSASRLTPAARISSRAAEPLQLSIPRNMAPASSKLWESGTPPTHGADSHGPHFLNPSRCTTLSHKKGWWRALCHSVMA